MGTSRPRILHVVGARPNFMKIAPVLRALEERGETDDVLLHSGQHYDANMSDDFFRDLGIRRPDVHLGIGSGSHGTQTAAALEGVERVLTESDWSFVVVVGDVNSTLAAALAAAKVGVPVAHVEAGLRSRDRRMPEEINRILTDQLSDLCLTPSRDADRNLAEEGISPERIRFVGNVMIDTLLWSLAQAEKAPPVVASLEQGQYVLTTIHRPSNVDDPTQLGEIAAALRTIAERVPVVFPVHPRTAAALSAGDHDLGAVQCVPPLGYMDMLGMQSRAGLVLTDSGGLQEESTVLGIPCLTLRSSTERPITITEGTNQLVPVRTTDAIVEAFEAAWGRPRSPVRPEGWDGETASRIADALLERIRTG